MYHQVSTVESDIWDIAVSPSRFHQHLQVFKQFAPVISSQELVMRLQTNTLRRRSIVITFDDGYANNFTCAVPLLTKFQLPATFFIVANTLTSASAYWWDELEQIFLVQRYLPSLFSLRLRDGRQLNYDLGNEYSLSESLRAIHQQWKARFTPPPTRRADLYHLLWQSLKSLPYADQQAAMADVRSWAQTDASLVLPSTMSLAQLQDLRQNPLFTIGAHTLTHPALAAHPSAVQQREMQLSKQRLSHWLATDIDILAYPYGNCTAATVDLARTTAFAAAFTTQAQTITNSANPYRLGRFQIDNWDGPTLKKYLRHWFTYC